MPVWSCLTARGVKWSTRSSRRLWRARQTGSPAWAGSGKRGSSTSRPWRRRAESALPTDPHPPDLGTLLDGVPCELTGMLGCELVVEGLGIVVVDEHVAGPGRQLEPLLEDDLVAL